MYKYVIENSETSLFSKSQVTFRGHVPPLRRRRTTLSVRQKMNILESLGKGFSNSDLVKMYGLSSSTISTIKKSRDSITKFISLLNSQYELEKRKRMRTGQNLKIEFALLQWITEKRKTREPISNFLLAEKARLLNAEFGKYPTHKALMSWLQRFVNRHGLKMQGQKK
ncbi:UNVERIFIED_CONTAM: hypothetical protein PYX00_001506 [Menopon gallinae]|uniref:HTH CENPB-type domain-containing protein n=1 Tax=Menopon gallinae TaxID=328185 RepID=A0AAW2IE07_9NEOP